jgi:hypothetical protein
VRRDYSGGLLLHTPPEEPCRRPNRKPPEVNVPSAVHRDTRAAIEAQYLYYQEPAHSTGWLYPVCDYIQDLAERYPGCVGQIVVETNHRNENNNATSVSMVEWLETWASFCAEFPKCGVLVRFEWTTTNSSPTEWMYWMAAMEMAITEKTPLALPPGQEEEWKTRGTNTLIDLEDDTAGDNDSGIHILPTNLCFAIAPYPKEQVRETLLAHCEASLITEAQVAIMAVHADTLFEQVIRGCETVGLRKARMKSVTVWALLRSTLVRVGIAHVRSSIYVAQPTSDSQFSAVLLLSSHRYKEGGCGEGGYSEREGEAGEGDSSREPILIDSRRESRRGHRRRG